MRWIKPTPPARGTIRQVEKFLWFPKRIGFETRWLETTAWNEEWERDSEYPVTGPYCWRALDWVNKINHQSVDRLQKDAIKVNWDIK